MTAPESVEKIIASSAHEHTGRRRHLHRYSVPDTHLDGIAHCGDIRPKLVLQHANRDAKGLAFGTLVLRRDLMIA